MFIVTDLVSLNNGTDLKVIKAIKNQLFTWTYFSLNDDVKGLPHHFMAMTDSKFLIDCLIISLYLYI